MIIELYGASDDLVELDVDGAALDEFSAYKGWSGRVLAPSGEGLRVSFAYAPRGGGAWEVRVTQLGGEPPIPGDWSVTIRQSSSCAYSPALVIDAPGGAEVNEDGPLR